MTNVKHILQMMAAAVLMTGCYHEVHDYPADSPSDVDATGFLGVTIDYEYPEDAGLPFGNLHVSVFQGDNTVANNDFANMDDVASWLERLPVGGYDVLVTQDMTVADGYSLNGGVVRLNDPSSSPDQAWYAMAHVTIVQDKITISEFEMQRLVATLELNISEVPDGTTIDVTVDHMSSSVDLMTDDYRGRLGQPSADFLAVPLGKVSQGGNTRTVSLTTGQQNLLPTSSDYDRTFIDLWVITPEGKELFCLGDTPRMESGHTYVIDLDYRKLKPYMYLEWYRINDWIWGAQISGGVEQPDEELKP